MMPSHTLILIAAVPVTLKKTYCINGCAAGLNQSDSDSRARAWPSTKSMRRAQKPALSLVFVSC